MLKLRDRNWFAENEKRIAVRCGRQVLLKLSRRIVVAEIGRASTRYERSGPDIKTGSCRHRKRLQAATDLTKKSRGYVRPRRLLHKRS